MEKLCRHLPSGNTCRIFRYEVVSRMIEALSNCDVIALGSGRSFASSRNSAFSFSRRDRAAFLLFSFMAQRADKPESEKNKKQKFMNQSEKSAVIKLIHSVGTSKVPRIISLFNKSSIISENNENHYSEIGKIYILGKANIFSWRLNCIESIKNY